MVQCLYHQIRFGNAGENIVAVHAPAFVGCESIDSDSNVVYGKQKAEAAAAGDDSGSGFSVVCPDFIYTGGGKDIALKRIPEKYDAQLPLLNIYYYGAAVAFKSMMGPKPLAFEFLQELFLLSFVE